MTIKRWVAVLTVAVVVMSAFSPGASAAKKRKPKKTKQEYAGSIMLPAPYAADGTCWTRLERHLAQAGDNQAAGFVGSHFDVDPRTYGQKFQLHVVSGSADVDLDIVFYTDFGDPSDPATAPSNLGYETRQAGGEEGTVPEGMTKAIVCMTTGQDAEFHYLTQ